MTNFDKQEQDIHTAFSQIDVDTENFKNKLNFESTAKTKKPIKLTSLAAAILIVLIASVTAYAATDGLYFIRSIFESPLIDYAVEQLEPVYAEDQGIRIEILAAEQIGDTILLYYTIQDVSGENLFASSSLNGINFTSLDWLFYIDGERILAPGGGFGRHIFNEETQTFYREGIFTGFSSIDIPNADTLTLVSDRVRTGGRVIYGDWIFPINVSGTDHPFLLWEDVTVRLEEGDYHFDYIRLNPLSISGTSTQCLSALFQNLNNLFTIEIELQNAPNIIARPGGGGDSFFWIAFDPFNSSTVESLFIDIEAVTAIIINGYRIEVAQ